MRPPSTCVAGLAPPLVDSQVKLYNDSCCVALASLVLDYKGWP